MPEHSITADQIANFLQKNPEFFNQHANLFAELRVPHPHQSKAISLGERQIITLRGRMRDLEWQLAGLIENATGNQRISKLLIDWCAGLLAQVDTSQIPNEITSGLSRLFDLPDIQLRIWNGQTTEVSTAETNKKLRQFCEENTAPICGSPSDYPAAASILPDHTASLAIIPLAHGTPPKGIGVLVLGSDNPDRFASDMGTEFLETISSLASAALSRLVYPQTLQIA